MNPTALARLFRERQLEGPEGVLEPRRALLTRKSLLLFTDDLVLKLRRPREAGPYDWHDASAMSVRYMLIARERWFGRQLNEGVYLEDCVLRADPDRDDRVLLHRGFVEGEPVVLMRRLPDALRADVLLTEVDPDEGQRRLEGFLQRLARFHAQAEAHEKPPFGRPERARERFEAFMEIVAPLLEPRERERLEDETGQWLERLAPTFAHRVMERRVRTVHGDLRMEHLFLGADDRDVALIDPNDDQDSERALDTAEEVMSLALELDQVICRAATDRAIEAYAIATLDVTLRRVARFYKRLGCLRRAAEAFIEGLEPDADQDDAHGRARGFIALALTC